MPAFGAGAAGAALGTGLANRVGDRTTATLPGLNDRGPGASQLPANPSIGDRRDSLNDRLGEGRTDREQARQDRQDTRGDRQGNRQENRGDRQETRTDRQENRQENRGDRQETRTDRQENRQENRGDRQENRQDIRSDRQERRDDIRQDWQDHRDEIREDWQNYRDDAREDWETWFDDHYGWYGDWYSGYAPEYWGQWDYLWDDYPVAAAAGLTWWGANAVGYLFGYSDYTNPYYVESMPAYYSEPIVSQPIITVQETAPTIVTVEQTGHVTAIPPSVSSEGVSKFDQARAAFLGGKYDAALKLTDEATVKMPRDAVLHEFRSLVLFALQRYAESAATIHPVLNVGPGWDWKTLSGLYPSTEVYTQQLRVLEAARDKDPKAPALNFLLGYHYLTCGYSDKAASEFQRVLEQRPNDTVSASLVATLAPREDKPAKASSGGSPTAVPPDSVAGNWKARGKDEATYSMTLGKDGTFTWGYTKGIRKQEVKGVHTIEGNVLAMEPDSGGVLLAELTPKDKDTLLFKMIGGASDNPGLEFRREPAKPGK